MSLSSIRSYNFRHYNNEPHSIWNRLPIARRSAVFILLFLGKFGELRVVLTKRSSKLKSFPGHISFPGGKADNGLETEWMTARREMEEEIGLPASNEELHAKFGFEIDHLNIMPAYLSRTFLAVRPCVGFMNFGPEILESDRINNLKLSLNPGESSSVFSCPLEDFLFPISNKPAIECIEREAYVLKWGGIARPLHSYTFPHNVKGEAEWLKDVKDLSDSDSDDSDVQLLLQEQNEGEKKLKQQKLELWGRLGSRRHEDTNEKLYDVWGLTASILHDLANVAYTNNAINREFGEEELIYSIWKHGQMRDKVRSKEEAKLISSKGTPKEFGFGDIIPRSEFNRLKALYKI